MVEAGPDVGLGHLRRMQVLAAALSTQNWVCHFAVSDPSMVDEIEKAGFLASVWKGNGLELGPVDVLIVDGYNYPPELVNDWKEHTGVCLIMDDMAEQPLTADIVLNHNIYGHLLDYSAYDVNTVIAGPDYSLVNARFIAAADSPRLDPNQLLISFGGRDDGCYSVPVVKGILKANSKVKCHIVSSPLRHPSAELKDLECRYADRVDVYHGADMADLMGRCSVMVGAAGYSLIEALVAGVRPVVCQTASNQRVNVHAFQAMGGRALDRYDPVLLVKLMSNELESPSNLKAICDGKGVSRVIDSIHKVMQENSSI